MKLRELKQEVYFQETREPNVRRAPRRGTLSGPSSRKRALPRRSTYRRLSSRSKLSMADRWKVYKDAVLDHFQVLLSSRETPSTGELCFRNTLERCLPSFSNLHTAGLRNHLSYLRDEKSKRYPMVTREISSLQNQLGFNPFSPNLLQNAAAVRGLKSPYQGGLFHSYVFSTLLVALGATQTRVAALENFDEIMVDDGLSLTTSEEEVVTPLLQQLESLSVRISSAHTQYDERQKLHKDGKKVKSLLRKWEIWEEKNNRPETEINRLLPLLAEAAPSIKSLDLTMSTFDITLHEFLQDQSDLDLLDAHFDWVSENFKFRRLTKLSLGNIIATLPSLKKFLQTTLHTLQHLTFNSFILTSESNLLISREEELQNEGQRAWREIFVYLRVHCEIQYFEIKNLGYHSGYRKESILFEVPSHTGPDEYPKSFRPTCYDTSHDTISFGAWIDQLEFHMTP